jgi:hypothetical protein
MQMQDQLVSNNSETTFLGIIEALLSGAAKDFLLSLIRNCSVSKTSHDRHQGEPLESIQSRSCFRNLCRLVVVILSLVLLK